jgi:hypothetical protein
MAAEITRVSSRSSAWFYRTKSRQNRGRDGGGGRDVSVMMTMLWARILKIFLPVDEGMGEDVVMVVSGAKRRSALAAGDMELVASLSTNGERKKKTSSSSVFPPEAVPGPAGS